MARKPYHGPKTTAGQRQPYFGHQTAQGARTPYTGTTPAAPPHRHGHHGLGGLVKNLGGDIGNAVEGLPMGLVGAAGAVAHDVRHHPAKLAEASVLLPVLPSAGYKRLKGTAVRGRVVEPIVKSYAQTYGPLRHGDVSRFLHNLYEHPLGPALDASALFTAGAGALAKGGSALAKVGAISEESRLARLGEAGKVELRSPRAIAGQEGGKVVARPTHTNPALRGRQVAVDKLLKRLPADLPFVGEIARFGRELDRLPRREAARLQLEERAYNRAVGGLSNEEFAALHIIGRGVHPADLAEVWKHDPAMTKVLANPKIRDLVEHPNAKLERAIPEARKLSDVMTELKIGRGILARGTAEERVGLHQRLAAKTLERELRPMAHKPFYVPDVAVAGNQSTASLGRLGGGTGVQRSIVKQNKGVLFHSARLALHPDLLGPEYMRTLKYGLFDDIHSELTASAVRMHKSAIGAQGLPEGYVFLRKKLYTKAGAPKPQQIGHLAKVTGEHQRGLADLIPDPGEIGASASSLAEGFGTTDAAAAEKLHGDYLIVPERLARQVAGEFHRSSRAARIFLEKPTRVWRTLVLGLRPGFFVNNVVGNHLMYAMHHAGPTGLRAYLNAVKRTHGDGMVKTLLRDHALPPALREQFMADFFPEQVQGTFGRTQFPAPGKMFSTKTGRRLRQASLGVGPATQAVAERGLRRAAVEAAIRKSPEFARVYRSMPRQTRDFETAARRLLSGEGGELYRRRISDDVNAVLGDYSNLSHFERTTLRSAAPFYAWYRAIAKVGAELAANKPIRADIYAHLGQQGALETRHKLGAIESFLRGAVPIGEPEQGHQRILATQGVNPFATIQQEGSGLSALMFGGNPDAKKNLLSQLNPFASALIQALQSGHVRRGTPQYGLLAQMLHDIAVGLPPVRLAQGLRGADQAPVPTRYAHTPSAAALSFLGIPLKDLNLPVEHRKARKAARS